MKSNIKMITLYNSLCILLAIGLGIFVHFSFAILFGLLCIALDFAYIIAKKQYETYIKENKNFLDNEQKNGSKIVKLSQNETKQLFKKSFIKKDDESIFLEEIKYGN